MRIYFLGLRNHEASTSSRERMAAGDLGTHQFRVPERLVKDPGDLNAWIKSQAYQDFTGFIHILNEAVKGKKTSDPAPTSPIIGKLTGVLDQYMHYIDETPPLEQPQRFGNKAYRLWSDRVRDSSEDVIKSLLPEELHGAVKELQPYLLQGFGNATRIDYGTGHEMKFAAFLCCLMKMGIIPRDNAGAVVTRVITRYLELMRRLQKDYRMEPAGSHGVWGLDDFQFLPFIWGASQLIGQSALTPVSFVDPVIAHQHSSDYIFMGCIAYINSVKTGLFAEHSNTLWGISSVAEWTKVNSGLIKMYKAEVLGKFPVIQHFPFGSVLSFEASSD